MSKLNFPRPFSIAIDDLGWMQGIDESENGNGPFRLGIDRNMSLKDYEAVVDLAKQVGVRLQGLFVLGELDREHILGDYPHITQMGTNWDNARNISNLQIEMMEYVKTQSAHLEFGLHGVGHEFWTGGVRKRAEWYNTEDNYPWPEEDIRVHVECFVKLMAQYGISEKKGHSFPESFVPCAYSYYWNPEGPYSLGSVLGEYGVKYANTNFREIEECNPPKEPNGGGFDHRVHVLNRYNYGNLWNDQGKIPVIPLTDQPTDYIETHWPNLLASDPDQQKLITQKWTDYYKMVQQSPDRYCAKNTAQHHSQWIHKKYTIINEIRPGVVKIDNRKMPLESYQSDFLSNLVLKVRLDKGQHVSKAQLNGSTIPGYFEEEDFAYLYLPQLLKREYELRYQIGPEILTDTVWHDGTSNILDLNKKDEMVLVNLRQYGHQPLKLITHQAPIRIESNNSAIEILDWRYEHGFLILDLKAHDLQGESGTLRFHF